MHGTFGKTLTLIAGLSLALVGGWTGLTLSMEPVKTPAGDSTMAPIIISHQGSSPMLERPPVPFDHDKHTRALKQKKSEDCAVCHVLKEADKRLTNPDVKVFKFPKAAFDETNKRSIMNAYHNECVSCHRNMAAKGEKTGPDIGLCGKCHVRRPQVTMVSWSWNPIFNYARHAEHSQTMEKLPGVDSVVIPGGVQIIDQPTGKKCELCHHLYDSASKKLIYKKDSETSCRSCHKERDEKNARSMRTVAHASCLGCHMGLAQKNAQQASAKDGAGVAGGEKKKWGPFDCKGCHGEHKELTPEEILKIPRLVRGQKDMMDLSLASAEKPETGAAQVVSALGLPVVTRMKAVPFNHKSHEPRAQFCNTCHHHSLEKCVNCHTPTGDRKKGGDVSYERAFHRPDAKQACVGCHAQAKQDRKCAGCHQFMLENAPPSSCAVCHRGPSEGKMIDIPPLPLPQDKEKVPEKVQIKVLEREFKPVELAHLKIVNSLITISNASPLARWFHSAKDQALCDGCHHRSQQKAEDKPPKCSSCHNRSFDPNALGKPGLQAAYHRQCIGCHEAMKNKPRALECVKCHAAKEGVTTAGLIPPLDESK